MVGVLYVSSGVCGVWCVWRMWHVVCADCVMVDVCR